jgi:hypothetical protein
VIGTHHFVFFIAVTSMQKLIEREQINPLNAELNPICHFLALLGAHHILRVSRIKVNANVFSVYLLTSNIIIEGLTYFVFIKPIKYVFPLSKGLIERSLYIIRCRRNNFDLFSEQFNFLHVCAPFS